MTFDKLPEFAEADRNLLQRVKGFLHQRGYAPHRTLEISVERGVVVVQGRVPTFYLRQIAFECIKRVAGVTQVVDLIEVADDPRQRQANGNSEDEQESSAVSTPHRVVLPDLTRMAQDTHRSPVRNRHRLSSAKG